MSTSNVPVDVEGEDDSTGTTRPAVELPADASAWVTLIRKCDEQIARLEESKKVARTHLETMLGDREVGVVNGRPVVRWTFVTARRFQQKKFAEQHPDLYDSYTASSTSRRFTLVGDKDSP